MREPFPRRNIVLIQMPFAVTAWPSLGLSLLKAVLTDAGHEVEILYLNLRFRAAIGSGLYEKIAGGAPQNVDLTGEWVFSAALWGRDPESDRTYFEQVLEGRDPAHAKPPHRRGTELEWAQLRKVAEATIPFLDEQMDRVDWTGVDIVGFTSTFQQHVASLALAKRLKTRHPHLRVVFGGANCEDAMGRATLRNFAFVDAVCAGEGETAFPAYVDALASNEAPIVPGMLTRGASETGTRSAGITDLEALPFPDFDDFFAAAAPGEGEDTAGARRLIFESSRGCWWGQKNHCTFCGLNGGTMAFRQKSGERSVRELCHLLQRYGRHTRSLTATDNIMPYDYFTTFLPKVAALGLELDLFYETKANLRKEQIRSYKSAGLTSIQPGIESLSTNVLKRMRKGVSALQNIQLLKWCRELGVIPSWNYLAGFPGEDPRSYAGADATIRKLTHLTPPIGVSTLRFDRFSPYTSHPRDFGITSLRPYQAYQVVYRGLRTEEMSELAYYFVGEFDGKDDVKTYAAAAFAAMDRWKAYHQESALFHTPTADETLVFDAREDDARIFRLSGPFHRLFARCDGITTRETLEDGEDPAMVDAVLDCFERYGFFLREDDRFVNVSLPLEEEYCPPPAALRKFERFYLDPGEHPLDGDDAVVISDRDLIRLDGEPMSLV